MALLQRVFPKLQPVFFSRTASSSYSTVESIMKTVFISQSKDIYTNLALQDWIHKNLDMSKQHVLMMWQNDPCVIVGRDENPWNVANIDDLPNITELGVKMARKNTYGSPIYQDNGNLNLTFFTPKERLDEDYNMNIISRALFREYSLRLNIIEGNFIVGNNHRISGTTSVADGKNAYHHCNLLVRTNKVDSTQSMTRKEFGIQQTNNKVCPESKMMNLCEENGQITVKNLIKTVGWEYLRTHSSKIKDQGVEFANKQKGFHTVNPTESWFPGLDNIRNGLSKWEWVYGETPNFTVSTTLRLPDSVGSSCRNFSDEMATVITVSKGLIKDITISIPTRILNSDFSQEINAVRTNLIGRKFSPILLNNVQISLNNLGDDKDNFIPQLLRQASSF